MDRRISALLLALVIAAPMPAGESSPKPLPVGGDVKPPVLIHRDHNPEFPEGSIMVSQTILIAQIVVRRDGTVHDVTILKAGGPIATKAYEPVLRKWRFRPGTRNGKPVDVIFNVTLNHTPFVQMGTVLSACGITLVFLPGWAVASEATTQSGCAATFRAPRSQAPQTDVQLHTAAWSFERELLRAGITKSGTGFVAGHGIEATELGDHRYRTVVARRDRKVCAERSGDARCPPPTAVFGTSARAATLRTSDSRWNRELLRILKSARFNGDPYDGRLSNAWGDPEAFR